MASRQRYRVTEKIDMGGMAEIYRGVATSIGGMEKQVAIKRVLPQLTKNEKFVKMFLDEARLSMHLNHANIVQVFDVGHAEDSYFIVMEFVDGQNLRRVFQKASEKNRKIPLEISVFLAIEICKALSHAHDRKDAEGTALHIVHRDLSPPNVMISMSGEVKIMDFGLAKATTQIELTDPGVVKGKFSYLSPEAAEGKKLDHRADLFSLGTVLFELLGNRRLFLGKTDVETVDMVRKCDIPSISKLCPEVPRELERVLNKSIAKDPKKRFASADEMGKALSDWLFEANQKVDSFDVAKLMKDLFIDKQQDSFRETIDVMIREEIINLSGMGLLSENFGAEGAKIIEIRDLSDGIQRSGKIPVGAIWGEAARQGRAAPGTRPLEPVLRSGSESLRGDAKSSRKIWFVLGFLLLLALAAGAFWFKSKGG